MVAEYFAGGRHEKTNAEADLKNILNVWQQLCLLHKNGLFLEICSIIMLLLEKTWL